jgi:hypothetical protein
MIYKNSVPTSQETHCLRYKDQPVNFVCENHKKHTDTLCGQKAESSYVKAGGTGLYMVNITEITILLHNISNVKGLTLQTF